MSSSSIASSRSCSSRAAAGGREDEHLDLVELVHAEHAARVLAGGARLAAEVRRVAGVPQRQRVRVEDLAHVHRREPDLGRAGEVELVALDLVDVHLVGRQEAGAVHRLLAHEHRRQHGHEALLRRAGRARSGRARARAARRRRCGSRSASRRPSPRAPCRSSRTPARGRDGRVTGKSNAGGSPTRAISTASSSVKPSGVVVVGRVRDPVEQLVAPPPPPRRARSSSAWSSTFTCSSSASCSGVGLPFSFRFAAQLLDARLQPRAQRGRRRAARRRARPRPCARAVAGSSSGSLRAAREVDHGVSLGSASSRAATPSSSTGGMTRSRARRISSCAFATATRKPAQSSSSRSFSPSPQATVCVGGEAEPVGDELRGRSPCSRPGARTRGSTAATSRRRAGPRSAA